MEPLKPDDPREIGGIRLVGRLGQGGMARVYFGATAQGEPVAVKVILTAHVDRPGIRERFEHEIIAMRMVQGPRIAAIVDASAEGEEHPWLAVEYIRGLTLREYVNSRGPLSAEQSATLGILLVEALTSIHRAQMLHRDLSPGNILLGQDGPKVIDFGLVQLADSDLTASGDLLGTPPCMSPEQITSPTEVTRAIDIYALAACLLFAATRCFPYTRPDRTALFYAITAPDILPDLDGLPSPLRPIIAAMLAKAPADRPGLGEVSDALTAVLHQAGLTPRQARAALVEATYVERPDDPVVPDSWVPETARPPKPRKPRVEPRMPEPVVARMSERMRKGYERGKPL